MSSGNDILTLAKTRIGQEYLLGQFVPKDDAGWSGPWDCAEFTSWLVFQKSGILYGCDNNNAGPHSHGADAFTGDWDRDAKAKGIIITVEEAAKTPGAFILRRAGHVVNEKTLGGHIVVSDGTGHTVEAHSKNDGVIASVVSGRRWDIGILIPGFQYRQTQAVVPVAPPATIIYRLTSPMMHNDKIKAIQQALTDAGFDTKGVDGFYGKNTQAAVINFQNARGLVPDGETGPTTAAALNIQL